MARKEKYTPEFYLNLKADEKLKWREVPFTCHCCGENFFVNKVKPKALPRNCSAKCRMDAFDPTIGATETIRVKALDWDFAGEMIKTGATAPMISAKLDVALSTVHRHIKKKFGTRAHLRMVLDGRKARKRAILEAMARVR
jgi:hypothetical protein